MVSNFDVEVVVAIALIVDLDCLCKVRNYLVEKYHLVDLYYSEYFFVYCYYFVVGCDEDYLHLQNIVVGFL